MMHIIGHSQFEKIQMSDERQGAEFFKGNLTKYRWVFTRYRNTRGEQFTVKQLMKRLRKGIEAKFEKLNDRKKGYGDQF